MEDMAAHEPRENRLLAALPAAEYARLADDLERVSLPMGKVLFESGDVLHHVYFPTSCIVSLVYTTEDGSSVELAMTGTDGLVGIPLVLGGETTTHRVVVQSTGIAYRLRADIVVWELEQGGHLQRLALRYAQAMMTQMAQSAVCNRHHTVDQRLCRWLLLTLDQLPGNELDMTQQLIANMLGVRREGITEAAGKLQAGGVIRYSRGHITVLDRPGLEAQACECYGVVKSEYDRLFKILPAVRPRARGRPNPTTLRRRAEARLKAKPKTPDSPGGASRLLHELQVHQIELEMHNEELLHAYNEADALRVRYADIYDFAPVAYITLDANGTILQLNLAAAILLGVKHSQQGRSRFAAFLTEQSLPAFNRLQEEVLAGTRRLKCDLVLAASAHRGEVTIRVEAVADESGSESRMVVIDTRSE